MRQQLLDVSLNHPSDGFRWQATFVQLEDRDDEGQFNVHRFRGRGFHRRDDLQGLLLSPLIVLKVLLSRRRHRSIRLSRLNSSSAHSQTASQYHLRRKRRHPLFESAAE